MSSKIAKAILNINPHAQFVVYGDEKNFQIEWHSINIKKPTQKEINDSLQYLETLEYKNSRKNAYPEIAEQLDMLWHSMNNGEIPKSELFFNTIKLIKEKYPKTE